MTLFRVILGLKPDLFLNQNHSILMLYEVSQPSHLFSRFFVSAFWYLVRGILWRLRASRVVESQCLRLHIGRGGPLSSQRNTVRMPF